MDQTLRAAHEKTSESLYQSIIRNLGLKKSEAANYERVLTAYYLRASAIVEKVRSKEKLTAQEVTFLNLVIKWNMVFQVSRIHSHGFKADVGQEIMKPADVLESLRFVAEARSLDAFVSAPYAPELKAKIQKAIAAPQCRNVVSRK